MSGKNDKLREISEQLEKGVSEVFDSERYKQWLTTMSRFHAYSLNNTILIARQKPNASYVAGYTSWQKNFDRHVKQGEKAIRIIAPAPYRKKVDMEKTDAKGDKYTETQETVVTSFRVVSVFDVSQTEGKELPVLVDELNGDVKNYDDLLEALKRGCPVPITYEPIEGSSKGFYSLTEKRIVVKSGMSQAHTIKTLMHEMTHQRLHDNDKDTTKNTKEVEAESVAYCLCQYFGIDTSDYSFAYVASWSEGKTLPELKASLQRIKDTASEMIEEISERLTNIAKERSDPEKFFRGQDGHTYEIVDRWEETYKDGTKDSYKLGKIESEGETQFRAVIDSTDEGQDEIAYDFADAQPTREQVKSKYADIISERELDRGEARTDPTIYVPWMKEMSRDEVDYIKELDPKKKSFDSEEFEKLIPDAMRYKETYSVNGNELYWVTQEIFTLEDLKKFQQALRDYNSSIERVYLTPRDLSDSYKYEEDMEKRMLAVVTEDAILSDDYVRAIKKAGYGDYLKAQETDDVKETKEADEPEPDAEEPEKEPAKKQRVYYTINEATAKTAHEMMSFSDYQMGSKTAEYKRYVDKAYDLADKIAEKKPEEAGRAYKMAERYSRKMAENMNARSRIGCMCPSVMISGAGNFPTRKKEKQNAAQDRSWQQFSEIQGILEKLERILYGKEIIKSNDERAIEKLEEKLENLKELQDMMKNANKAIRMSDTEKGNEILRDMGFSDEQIQELRKPDYMGRVGYPSWAMQNNNANIHRIEDRIEDLKAVKDKGTQETENEFFRVIENTENMRLQLIFEDKPEPEVREILKSNGFKWAPSQSAWQRQLTDNARYSLKCVVKALQERNAQRQDLESPPVSQLRRNKGMKI